jgi:hypothetical protein
MDEQTKGNGRGKAEGSRQTQFKPGQSGNPSGLSKGITDPPSGSQRPVDMLAEYDGILERPKAEDATDLQRRLRRMYEDDFSGFMRIRDREADRRQKNGAESKPDAASDVQDEGSAKALAVLVEFMKGLNERC